MGLYPRLDYKKSKKDTTKDDEVRVVIDYYYNGERTKITTGVSCLVKDWDENWRKKPSKKPIKTTDREHRGKNLLIQNKLDEINGVVLTIQKQDKEPIVPLVKSYLRKERKERKDGTQREIHFLPLLVEYENYIKSEHYENRESTRRWVLSCIKQIIEYTTYYQNRNNTLLFPDELDRDWVYGFIKWSFDTKGLKPSTIKKRVKVLSHFSNWSKEKYNTTFQIRKPKKVFLGTDENLDIVFLTRDEVVKLYKYEGFDEENPEHVKILTKEKRLTYMEDRWIHSKEGEKSRTYTTFEVYKDMLVFLVNVGCRWGDLVDMKVGDLVYDKVVDKEHGYTVGYFSYYMGKIKNQRNTVKVPRNKITFEIYKKYSTGKNLEHHIFPRTRYGNSITNQKFNNYIKEVCRIVGLNRKVKKTEWNLNGEEMKDSTEYLSLHEVVSSHIGRKTFIRTHIQKGTPIRTIMKMTGHKSRKVFDGYYEILDEDIKYKNDDLFSEMIVEENKSLKTQKIQPQQKTTSPFSKEKEQEIEKLKYSLDKEWITQEKYDELFQKMIIGE
jgi:integrase